MNTQIFEKPIFSQTDYAILRSAIKRLPGLLSAVVEQRFWARKTVDEIADDFGVSAYAIDCAIIKAQQLLREECMRHPSFSRADLSTIKALQAKFVA